MQIAIHEALPWNYNLSELKLLLWLTPNIIIKINTKKPKLPKVMNYLEKTIYTNKFSINK